MTDIGPGDWVECIGACDFVEGPNAGEHAPCPAVGDVCQVDGLKEGGNFEDGIPALELRGYDGRYLDGGRWCYSIDAFRPIYRPKSELIAGLLEPSREVVIARGFLIRDGKKIAEVTDIRIPLP